MADPDRGRFGASAVVSEAVANVFSMRRLTALLALLAASVGFVVTATATADADRAIREGAELDRRGRNLLRVTSTFGRPASLDLAFCDRLASVGGIEAAGGIRRQDRVRLASGTRVRIQDVSVGMTGLVGRGDVTDPAVLLSGALAAERNGLRDGSWITIPGERGVRQPLTVQLVPQTERTARLDDSLLRIVAPNGPADECWAAVDPGRRVALTAAIQDLLPPEDPGVVVEFNPALHEAEPERDLREVPRSPITVFGGLAVALVAGMWWYGRRQEWTLYRVFGLGVVARSGIMFVEWLLVGAIPTVVGAAWAIMFADQADRQALLLGWSAAGVAVLSSATVIGLWAALSARPRPSTVLKGG